MLAQGLVITSTQDGDAPNLPAVATVSKDDEWDDGGYALGQAACASGRFWVDRPYFTGNPSVDWMVQKCDRVTSQGGWVQLGNEQNLALEGWQGGLEAWWAFDAEVRARVAHPERLLAMPPSPGMPNWPDWVTIAGPHAVHAYGDFSAMRAIVEAYLSETDGDLVVTECNFGAGNAVDVDAWALEELEPFLDWCAGVERLRAVAYFAWRWRGAPPMPTPVDAAGTGVQAVLSAWLPPSGGGADGAWYPDAVRRAISCNYTAGRAGTVRAVVAHITDGLGSPFGWFNTPRGSAGSSAHFWVSRTGTVEQYRPLGDTCWANGPVCAPDLANAAVAEIVASGQDPNARTVAVEHEGFPSEPLTPEQTAASRDLTSWLCRHYGLHVGRDDVVGHYQIDSCARPNCPGPAFDWQGVLGTAAPAFDVAAARDQLWAIATACEQGGYPWLGQGVKSAVALSKGDR